MRIVAESRSFNSVNIVNSIREELESSAPVGSSASTMAGFVTIALGSSYSLLLTARHLIGIFTQYILNV